MTKTLIERLEAKIYKEGLTASAGLIGARRGGYNGGIAFAIEIIKKHDSAQQEKLKEVRSGLAEAVGIYETDGDSDQRIRKMHDEVVLALSIVDSMITGER